MIIALISAITVITKYFSY